MTAAPNPESLAMRAMSSKSKVMMIAVEFGAEWRFSMRPAPGVDLVMVIQTIDEEPFSFARRFQRKLLNILDSGSSVVSAALAVAPMLDACQLKARCAIARTLLQTLRGGENSRLQLVEAGGATPDCHSQLAAIADGASEYRTTDSGRLCAAEAYDCRSCAAGSSPAT